MYTIQCEIYLLGMLQFRYTENLNKISIGRFWVQKYYIIGKNIFFDMPTIVEKSIN